MFLGRLRTKSNWRDMIATVKRILAQGGAVVRPATGNAKRDTRSEWGGASVEDEFLAAGAKVLPMAGGADVEPLCNEAGSAMG
jgi:hypothetical protein